MQLCSCLLPRQDCSCLRPTTENLHRLDEVLCPHRHNHLHRKARILNKVGRPILQGLVLLVLQLIKDHLAKIKILHHKISNNSLHTHREWVLCMANFLQERHHRCRARIIMVVHRIR